MAFTTLISTDALAQHIKDAAYAIFDCRFELDDPRTVPPFSLEPRAVPRRYLAKRSNPPA